LLTRTLEATMQIVADQPHTPTAIRTDLGAIFVSLELSRSIWLITSLPPGGGERMSKHSLRGGDVAGLLERFAQIRKSGSDNRDHLSAQLLLGARCYYYSTFTVTVDFPGKTKADSDHIET
jgi:hypothetical protein